MRRFPINPHVAQEILGGLGAWRIKALEIAVLDFLCKFRKMGRFILFDNDRQLKRISRNFSTCECIIR